MRFSWWSFALLTVIFMRYLLVSADVTVTKSDNVNINGFSLTKYVSGFGYAVEVHKNIETEDGYLLDAHRIPYGRTNNTDYIKRPVAFLMHGLVTSADCFVVMGPERGLAFLLADRGYDVWMGSARGTVHSRNHTRLDPKKDAEYWDFSWHEIGYYDLPAYINYILRFTGQSQLFYIGHSQGGTAFYVMASSMPNMNQKIKLAVLLAPGVFYGIKNVALPQKEASLAFQYIEQARRRLRINEIGPQLRQLVCHIPIFTDQICDVAIIITGVSAGLDLTQFNISTINTVKKILPDSAAARQFLHYMQLFLTADFRQYDFGAKINKVQYGSEIPPSYDIKKATAPAALFAGLSDVVVTVLNVKRLARELPNVIYDHIVSYPLFTHLDFILANDVVKLVYSKVFELMDQHMKK